MKTVDFSKQFLPEGIPSTVRIENVFEKLQQYKEEGTVVQATIDELKMIKDNPYWILNLDGGRGIVGFDRTGLAHPNQMAQFVGQEVFVKIFHLNQSEKGIIVSADRKAVIEEAKDRIFEVTEVGQIRTAVVRGIGDNTVHVDIGGGFIVPVARKEATLSKRHTSLRNLFKIGDVIDVKVMNINIAEETIEVSHAAVHEDVWQNAKYGVGDIVTAEIVHISNQSELPTIFVEVKPGVDALLAINSTMDLKVGIRIRGRVTQFNPDRKRLRVKFQAII